MPTIAWDETTPADASNATNTDDTIRSDITAVATGLGGSFYWPGSAESQGDSTASTGETRTGSARYPITGAAAQDATPLQGNAFGNGFVGFNRSPSSGNPQDFRLYHAGSSNTFPCGNADFMEELDDPGADGVVWHSRGGQETIAAGGSTISYGVTYNGIPLIRASVGTSVAVSWGITNVGTSAMSSRISTAGELVWESLGTISISISS